jgi:hypothetical protein
MTTAANPGLGTQLKREDTPGSGTYSLIPECKDVAGPSPTPEFKECTTLESTAKEFKVVNVDPGEVSFTMYLRTDNAIHALMRADAYDPSQPVRNYQRVDTADTPETMTFAGQITKWDRKVSTDDFDTVEVTIKCSGTPTFA